MSLHNGTIYRWNRPVYAVVDGQPHLRVENRVLPAGPTVADVMANAAFYYGLIRALADEQRPVWTQMTFATAAENLHEAARHGLDARLYWPGLGEAPVAELVLRRLLPLAREGLAPLGRRSSRCRPPAGHHRAALPHRPERRHLADRDDPAALTRRGADRTEALRADDPALYRAHARQRAGPHLAGEPLEPRTKCRCAEFLVIGVAKSAFHAATHASHAQACPPPN